MTLAAAAAALDGARSGADVSFDAVTTDSRALQGGALFVALKGPHFDGHDFLAQAATAGAVAALVERPVTTTLPCVQVADTRLALGRLAAHWRDRFHIPVLAVTGSNGKTTVKEMLAAILAETGPGCVTRGNLNNDIGAPLTLLRLRAADRYAVIEMGMNHPGEIEYLTRLARPTVALINNAAEAHLKGLGSVEAVARAKGEIFAGLAADGVAVINADDAHAGLWRALAAPRRCVSFGLAHAADVSAEYTTDLQGSTVHIHTPLGGIAMRLPLPGRHNVMNALAATAAALQAGARLVDVKNGLEKLRAVSGRLEIKCGQNGATVLDDSYNANPGSLAAGLEVLKDCAGEKVLVLGDMGELGDAASEIHARVGRIAKRLRIDRLYALGELTRETVAAFGPGAHHFASDGALIDALRTDLSADMTVLVKGSRAMHMERVVAGICAPAADAPRQAETA